jgi:hypothetical protein
MSPARARSLCLVAFALGAALPGATATAVSLPRESRVPGGIALIPVAGATTEPVATFEQPYGYSSLDRVAKASATLE